MARLEHANVTVRDSLATADLLVNLFDWSIRWQGESIYGGYSVHVGEVGTYLALYTPKQPKKGTLSSCDNSPLSFIKVINNNPKVV